MSIAYMYLYFILGSFWAIFPATQTKKTKSAQGQLTNMQIQKYKYTNIKNAVPMSNVQYV